MHYASQYRKINALERACLHFLDELRHMHSYLIKNEMKVFNGKKSAYGRGYLQILFMTWNWVT